MNKEQFFEKLTKFNVNEKVIALISRMPESSYACVSDYLDNRSSDDERDINNCILHVLVFNGYKHDDMGREIMDPFVPELPKGCKVPDTLDVLLQKIYRNPEIAFKARESQVFQGVDEDLEEDDEYFDEQETPWEVAGRQLRAEADSEPAPANKEPVTDGGATDPSDGANEPVKPKITAHRAMEILRNSGFDVVEE